MLLNGQKHVGDYALSAMRRRCSTRAQPNKGDITNIRSRLSLIGRSPRLCEPMFGQSDHGWISPDETSTASKTVGTATRRIGPECCPWAVRRREDGARLQLTSFFHAHAAEAAVSERLGFCKFGVTRKIIPLGAARVCRVPSP